MLNVLAEARIWHPTAEGAAEHVRHIWNDVGAWWSSPPVSEARARWSAAYALTVEGGIDSVWIQTLKTL